MSFLSLPHTRTCNCQSNHLNCLTASEWLKCMTGVWQFAYEGRDIRDKSIHPAVFPIGLAKRVINLFTHAGELVLDPLQLCEQRLGLQDPSTATRQIVVQDDARNIPAYLAPETVSLIWTSPPYANTLNRRRKNKSLRDRKNEQYGKVEQYSQDPRDLGTMALEEYTCSMGDIFEKLLPLLRPKAHCVINVPDIWWGNRRVAIHIALTEELQLRGYELRNTIIWDRTNVVNRMSIFGWPSNFITMGTTFEYLLDFWRPA
jgi:DNA modification methylase